MKKNEMIFVYGTLRPGERADLRKGAASFGVEYLGQDEINGDLFDTRCGFPGAVVPDGHFDPSIPHIKGDVFWVRDESIEAVLDAYEGYPHLYNRKQVETAAGRIVWVYTYNPEVTQDQLIVTGDWQNQTELKIVMDAA